LSFESTRLAPLGEQTGGEQQQLVFFSRGQFHDFAETCLSFG
jgi:hypothetical protein